MSCGVKKGSKQFQAGMKIEGKEHPGFSKRAVAQIVTDHLKEHPNMYRNAKK